MNLAAQNKEPMYYFCKDEKNQFINPADFRKIPSQIKHKYRPATFEDVRLYGSDELKKEIEPIRYNEFSNALLFGSLK